LGVPGNIRRYVLDRVFAAFDRGSQAACGKLQAGASYGYSTFFRLAGADPGDVLLAEFDLGANRVELSLVDEVVLEGETLVE